MSSPRLRIDETNAAPVLALTRRDARPVGQILEDRGKISSADLRHGLAQQRRIDAPLGDILVSEGLTTQDELYAAVAAQFGLSTVDLSTSPPQPHVAGLLSANFCLQHEVVPWLKMDGVLYVATARPDRFEAVRTALPSQSLVISPVLADPDQIRTAQANLYSLVLAWHAERRVPEPLSCRDWEPHAARRAMVFAVALTLMVLLTWAAPGAVWLGLCWLAMITLALSMSMKICALIAQMSAELGASRPEPTQNVTPIRLPRVSVMVPLLHEKEIAGALVKRLGRLTYPKALLDVVLVLEEEDHITRTTLAATKLPAWMRVVEVPAAHNGLTTKPRALNYALDFCKGRLVGIWDAEDAPEPDQIEKVVNHFHAAGPDVACLQGQLDYYNPASNWIARCFTIEYAAWWRVVMPGLARLGFVIPLGGTTLFFRREVLEDLGGWDAHNVTEDADLGVRLARAGYRTELIPTVTFEEANCRAWPWVRQRSRWLKGFAITWIVHMRAPGALLKDLGLARFLGLQLFFLTALSQFLLAPVFWSFWFIPLGVTHPFATGSMANLVFYAFLGCEILTLGLHLYAVRRPHHRHLMVWTLTMILYFPMACLAMYKAVFELVARPFFWDKTQHGVSPEQTAHGTSSP